MTHVTYFPARRIEDDPDRSGFEGLVVVDHPGSEAPVTVSASTAPPQYLTIAAGRQEIRGLSREDAVAVLAALTRTLELLREMDGVRR